jgi:hypothetical protein
MDTFKRSKNMGAGAGVKRSRIERRKKARRRQQFTTGFFIVAGAGLILSAAWLVLGSKTNATVDIDYGPEDIAYDQPLHAVHEMEAGPPIPFLPREGPQPKIAVNERFFDFGSIGATEVVTRDFVVANLGDAPLTVSRAYTTCGCTVADFTSSVIPPGMVSIVTLTLDAGFHDVRGQTVRRGIIIENNDPELPSAEIWVEASVRSGS